MTTPPEQDPKATVTPTKPWLPQRLRGVEPDPLGPPPQLDWWAVVKGLVMTVPLHFWMKNRFGDVGQMVTSLFLLGAVGIPYIELREAREKRAARRDELARQRPRTISPPEGADPQLWAEDPYSEGWSKGMGVSRADYADSQRGDD